MIQIIDKQIDFLNIELKENPSNVKVIELIRILELFKDILNLVLSGEKSNSSSLALFVTQLTIGRGDVNFVNVVTEFMKTHKVKQIQVNKKTGISQARVSEFLNHKHAMQSDTMEKLFSVIS